MTIKKLKTIKKLGAQRKHLRISTRIGLKKKKIKNIKFFSMVQKIEKDGHPMSLGQNKLYYAFSASKNTAPKFFN